MSVSLEKCFEYWDGIIKKWLDPNEIPALLEEFHGINENDLEYIPEPWWGWNEVKELKSVCINLNPGAGNKGHTKEVIKDILSGKYYKESIDRLKSHQPFTESWHVAQRAHPLIKLTENDEDISECYNSKSHLSIEICPFHSKYSTIVENYVQSNPHIIKEYVLNFAAEASKRICNETLKNKVFIRMGHKRFLHLLSCLGYGNKDITILISKNKSNLCIRFIKEWPDIDFIVNKGIWNSFKITKEDLSKKNYISGNLIIENMNK